MEHISHTIRALRALLAVLLILGLMPVTVHAQSGDDALRFSQRFPATGVRAMGMAGAGIAGIADYSALYSNPAGLGYFQHSSFSASLNTLSTEDAGLYQLATSSNALTTDVRDTGLNHLAYVYKVPTAQGSLVFAAAYTQVGTFERNLGFQGTNDLNSITDFFMPVSGEYDLEQDAGTDGLFDTADDEFFPSFNRDLSFIAYEAFGIDFDRGRFDAGEVPFLPAVTAGTVLQTGSLNESGQMREVSFGMGLEAFKEVMFGLSVNIPFGRYRYSRIFEEDDINNDNDGFNGTTDFEFMRLTDDIRSDLVGINMRAGFSASVRPGIRAGLNIESPTLYTINESFNTQLDMFFDNGDAFSYGDDFDETVGAGEFEYNITTPWRLSAGLGFEAGGLQVYGDAEFVDWTQLQLDAQGFSFTNENRAIENSLDAVINTRIGGEFSMGKVILRGGFAYMPDPRKDTSTLDRSRTSFSAGLGYRFAEQFMVDLGWSQERFDDEYLPYVEVNNAPVIQEEVVRNRFAVGVRMLF